MYQSSPAADFLLNFFNTMLHHQKTVQRYYDYRRLANHLFTAKITKDPGLNILLHHNRNIYCLTVSCYNLRNVYDFRSKISQN